MIYAKVEQGIVTDYPLCAGDIMLRFPDTSFAIPFVPPDGYQEVRLSPHPATGYLESISESKPVFIDGVLTQQWIVTPASESEITQRTDAKAAAIRSERNILLQQSDWTQLPDSMADAQAWAEYRQLLRDITSQEGFPWSVQWPERPN